MNSPLLWQLKFIGLTPYWMQYSKRSEELGLKFPIPFGLDVFVIESNFVTRGVAVGLYSLVVGLFLKLLSIVKVLSIHNHQFLELY